MSLVKGTRPGVGAEAQYNRGGVLFRRTQTDWTGTYRQVKTLEPPTLTPTLLLGYARKKEDLTGLHPPSATFQIASHRVWTPPHRSLPPRNPPSAPTSQVLAERDQTLMNRTDQNREAAPADLIAKVLASDAGTRLNHTHLLRLSSCSIKSSTARISGVRPVCLLRNIRASMARSVISRSS